MTEGQVVANATGAPLEHHPSLTVALEAKLVSAPDEQGDEEVVM